MNGNLDSLFDAPAKPSRSPKTDDFMSSLFSTKADVHQVQTSTSRQSSDDESESSSALRTVMEAKRESDENFAMRASERFSKNSYPDFDF